MRVEIFLCMLSLLLIAACGNRAEGNWFFLQVQDAGGNVIPSNQQCTSIHFLENDEVIFRNNALNSEMHYKMEIGAERIALQPIDEPSEPTDTITIDWSAEKIMRICFYDGDSIQFCGFFSQDTTAACR